MARQDRLENGLMASMPWLVFLVALGVRFVVETPRPVLPHPERLLLVGKPSGSSAGVVDEAREGGRAIARLSQPALLDLARSEGDWLRRWSGGYLARAELTFDPEQLQPVLATSDIEHGAGDIDLEVSFPRPDDLSPRQLMVTVWPFHLLPPATVDVYVYDLRAGRPAPVLALRDQPAAPILTRTPSGELVLGNESLWRRNRNYVWTGEAYQPQPVRAWLEHVTWQLAGAFAALPWWGWLLCAPPLAFLLVGCGEALVRVNQASRRGRTGTAEMLGVLALVAALAGWWAAVLALRLVPSLDLATGLLTPVSLALLFLMVCRLTARLAEREAAPRG